MERNMTVFDFDDLRWSWEDMARSLNARYGQEDVASLVLALISEKPKMIDEILSWKIVKDRMGG